MVAAQAGMGWGLHPQALIAAQLQQGTLVALLPDVPFNWVEFKVGQMGIFVLEREDMVAHHASIKALADARRA